MKEALSQKNVEYAYVDILSGMFPLKTFLKIRDHNESHKQSKESGGVGLPTISIDGETFILSGKEDVEKIADKLI